MRRKRGRGRLRRLRAGLVTPLPGGLGSPSARNYVGLPSMAGRGADEGGESLPDRVS